MISTSQPSTPAAQTRLDHEVTGGKLYTEERVWCSKEIPFSCRFGPWLLLCESSCLLSEENIWTSGGGGGGLGSRACRCIVYYYYYYCYYYYFVRDFSLLLHPSDAVAGKRDRGSPRLGLPFSDRRFSCDMVLRPLCVFFFSFCVREGAGSGFCCLCFFRERLDEQISWNCAPESRR